MNSNYFSTSSAGDSYSQIGLDSESLESLYQKLIDRGLSDEEAVAAIQKMSDDSDFNPFAGTEAGNGLVNGMGYRSNMFSDDEEIESDRQIDLIASSIRNGTIQVDISRGRLNTELNSRLGFNTFAEGGDMDESWDWYDEASSQFGWYPSRSILKYIKKAEGFRPYWYKDGNGIDTIGYGFTDKRLMASNPRWMSRKDADRQFRKEIDSRINAFISATPNFSSLTPDQRDSLFDYYYNVGHGRYTKGSPKMQAAMRSGDLYGIASNMDAGYYDRRNPGLRKRRDYERSLFGLQENSTETKPTDNKYELDILWDSDTVKWLSSQNLSDRKLNNKFYPGGQIDTGTADNSDIVNVEGGYTISENKRNRTYETFDPALGLEPISAILGYMAGGNQSHGEENEYWRAYLGLSNNVPKMNSNAKTSWDDKVEADKIASGELSSDFYGTTDRMDQTIQVIADTLNVGNVLRNYDAYKLQYPSLADKSVLEHIYEQGKQVMDNPGKWVQITEGPQIHIDTKRDITTNEIMPLGMLADFGMMWSPEEGVLKVHDTYDFPKWATALSSIPERPKEMKIRGRINYDPKKGSILLRDGEYHKELTAKPIANKYSH